MFKHFHCLAVMLGAFILFMSVSYASQAQTTQPSTIVDPNLLPASPGQPEAVGRLLYKQKFKVQIREGDDPAMPVGSIAFEIYQDKKTGNIQCVTHLHSTYRQQARGFKNHTTYLKQKDGSYKLAKGWTRTYKGQQHLLTGTFEVKEAHLNIKRWLHYDVDNQFKLPVPAYEASTLNLAITGPAMPRFESYVMPVYLFPENGATPEIQIMRFPSGPSSKKIIAEGAKVNMMRRPGPKAGHVIYEGGFNPAGEAGLFLHFDEKGRLLKVLENGKVEITPDVKPAATQAATQPDRQ